MQSVAKPLRAALMLLLACPVVSISEKAQAREPAPITGLWAKPGRDRAATDLDVARCRSVARLGPVDMDPNPAGVGGAVGYLAGALVAHEMAIRQTPQFVIHCMRRLGYGWLEFTDDERRAFEPLSTPGEKAAWLDAFYAADQTKRIAKARTIFVDPLPGDVIEPFAVAGVRFDPAALTAPKTPITTPDSVVLSGPISHRRTARLKQEILVPGSSPIQADSGSVMHEVVYPGQYTPSQVYWCLQVRTRRPKLLGGAQSTGACFAAGELAYEASFAGGRPWLNTDPDLRMDPVPLPDATLAIEESDVDLLGPMDFKLLVTQLRPMSVSVEARAMRGGQSVVFWTADLAFDAKQRAVLPFWSHRLTLTRSGGALKVAYTADGDGTGWERANVYR